MQEIVEDGITYSLPDQIVLLDGFHWRKSWTGITMIVSINFDIDFKRAGNARFELHSLDPQSIYHLYISTWISPKETLQPCWLTPKQFEALKAFL